jgi:methylated-DNA-[protein]-cysteine S-methyltransferase
MTETTLTFETAFGSAGVAVTADGLRRVHLPGGRLPRAGDTEPTPLATKAATQIAEYLEGARNEFELPLDWSGVDARHRNVLEALLAAAPFGRTITYGELGQRAGESDPREIGAMMARNPIPLVVPCHRVVAADGLGGFGGGIELKRRLLELEHVLPPRLPLTG